MHIPDGFLSAPVTAATIVVAAASVGAALRAEARDPQPMPAGMLGAVAAFLFAAQMINVPVAPGISGHLIGGALAAALLGPWRALIAMAVVLIIQSLLFQDGGVGALGANIIDMGVAGVAAGYAVPALMRRWTSSPRSFAVGVMLGAFVSALAAATLAGCWLGLSGLYPTAAIVQLLVSTHTVVGVLEAVLTGAILVTVLRWRPDLVRGRQQEPGVRYPVATLIGMLAIAVAVAAFVSPFASALPDGLERAAVSLGFAAREQPAMPAPFANYALPFVQSGRVATALAGTLGTLAVAAAAWFISRSLRSDSNGVHR